MQPTEEHKPHEYPGGVTWVDKEFDPNFIERPSFSKRFKNSAAWLRDNVLARVIIGIVLSVLTVGTAFVISRLPKPPSETPSATTKAEESKAQPQDQPAINQKQPQQNPTVNNP